jgi:PPOX class probable F420-dependent enzyme
MSKRFVTVVTLVLGLGTLATGLWALTAPGSFASFVNFPEHEHFLHDIGAFQLGIGATLLVGLLWRDGLATALAGFGVGNTVHAVNHALDQHLGGHAGDAWALAAVSVLTAVALWLRLRGLGYVVGPVALATSPELARFVEQKTVVLTSYRRDGTPVPTPISIAVDGASAVVRSYLKAGKVRRIRHNPVVELAPSTMRGKPTGDPIRAELRLLSGTESRQAARLLRRKYPLLHGVVVPLSHRLMRAKTGRTVHFRLVPLAKP